jgi:putative transposase
MQVGYRTRCYPDLEMDGFLTFCVNAVRGLKNAKTADEQYQFWLRKTAILSPSWTGPNPEGEWVIDQCYSQYKDKDLSPWLYAVPSQLLRNRIVEHHKSWQNHFRDPKAMKVPTFQAKGQRDTLWLTKELFRPKTVQGRWLTLEIGTEANPEGLLRVRLHRPKPGGQIVVPSFDSIHLRRLAWGDWALSGSYEDGQPEITLDEVLARVLALDPAVREQAVKAVDRGINVVFADSDGRKANLSEKATARIDFLDGKIKHFQRALARQKKGSRHRLVTKARIARMRAEIAGLVDEFICQEAAQFAKDPKVQLGAFEDLKLRNMTRKPKAKWDEATGRYLRNNARAKAGLNRAFLRVAPGKAKLRHKNALSKRGKALMDVRQPTAARNAPTATTSKPRTAKVRYSSASIAGTRTTRTATPPRCSNSEPSRPSWTAPLSKRRSRRW